MTVMTDYMQQNNSSETNNLNADKCQRKNVFRRTIDYNSAIITKLKQRICRFDTFEKRSIQPDYLYNPFLETTASFNDQPAACVTPKLIRTATNKKKCPIYCVCVSSWLVRLSKHFKWTPEGRRLITGANSGEFTLWNGLTFNFETILQAHESQIRCMKWSHNGEWLLTADNSGFLKYWQANMNNVQVYQAHKEPIRGVSFCPFDQKFVTCSDDSTVRIWDFNRCAEERVLRGHGSDVRCVAWHPTMSLIISGSKDAQQPIKLWEPKTGSSITTLYVHKSTCTDVAWNKNGNWFLTASRDHSVKLFDVRNMTTELQTFRGHKRDVVRVAWNPIHETLFASGSGDGAIHYWNVGTDCELTVVDDAHEGMIWSLAWHPLGHILVSGANDFQTKFWSRNRPGDVPKEMTATSGLTGLGDLLTTPINAPSAQSAYAPTSPSTTAAGEQPTRKLGTQLPEFVGPEASAGGDADERAFVEEASADNAADIGVAIPGINEGTAEDLNLSSQAWSQEERNRQRMAKSIPRDFAQKWATAPTQHSKKHCAPPHEDDLAFGMAAAPQGMPEGQVGHKRPPQDERGWPPQPRPPWADEYGHHMPPMPGPPPAGAGHYPPDPYYDHHVRPYGPPPAKRMHPAEIGYGRPRMPPWEGHRPPMPPHGWDPRGPPPRRDWGERGPPPRPPSQMRRGW